MKLKELSTIIDRYIEQGHENDEVLITLKESSIGARACSEIQGIYSGFDWEQGQIRIEPQKPLISYGKNRDVMMEPKSRSYKVGDKNRTYRLCPKCDSHLRKDDRYCSCCGQRVMTIREEGSDNNAKKTGN